MACPIIDCAGLKALFAKCFSHTLRDNRSGAHTLTVSIVLLFAVFLLPLLAPSDNPYPTKAPSTEPHNHFAYANRLISSRDPYLLLHAHNPVDWYPWGAEALAKARSENKPIFISIGYSTCYWCHVAERIIYSDPKIAKLMNQWFVNIKVDREQSA
jgi:thioredoxin-related protein